MKTQPIFLVLAMVFSSSVFAIGDGKPKGTFGFSTNYITQGPDFGPTRDGGIEIRVRGAQAVEIASLTPSDNTISIFSQIDCSKVPDYGGHPGTYDPDNKLCDSIGSQVGVIKRLQGAGQCYQDFIHSDRSTCLFGTMERYHTPLTQPLVLDTISFGPAGAESRLKALIDGSPYLTQDGKVELIYRYIGLKRYAAEVILKLN